MRPGALFHLYRNRLRVHAAQELLAGFGVAIAVALVFATLVANQSIAGSAEEVIHAVIGPASLQIRTSAPDGLDEHLLARVEHMAGVRQAAPLLEQTATIAATHGQRLTIELAGADTALATLDGLAHTLPTGILSSEGIGLTSATARALGISSAYRAGRATPSISLRLRGRAYALKVSAVLGHEAAGALSGAQVAVMPLGRLQRLAGLQRRISRILVETAPGRESAVRSGLQALSAGRLMVAPADQDVTLLHQALGPSGQASGLFAAISALLGFLFAFNAMLLTVPERRQAIADLRVDGARRSAIMQLVLFQGICLGVVSSLAGLLAGYELSVTVFHQSPGYLAQAFTLGGSTVIGAKPLLLSLAGGVLATSLASMIPLLDLRRGRALDAVYFDDGIPGNELDSITQRWLPITALILLLLASVLFVLVSSAALIVCVMLALVTVLAVPTALTGILHTVAVIANRSQRLTLLPVALTSLRATTMRSLALAATGAVALFGSVALGGARADLLRGLNRFATTYVTNADIWLLNPGDTAGTNSFRADDYTSRIAYIQGVKSVRTFQSEFMNIGNRRVWVIARPPGTSTGLLGSQIVKGNAAAATARLNERGWIAVSQQIAEAQHVQLGGSLALPTPSGSVEFRLAAMTTNFGWTAGAVLMNTVDYGRLWKTTEPTALGVELDPGASVAKVQHAINAMLGPAGGLEAVTASTRAERFDSIAGEGLSQLGDIATLLVFAAILAMVAALGSSIWQRRESLAGLRVEGTKPSRLRRVLLIEAILMLSAGCLTGALAGVYGQIVIDSYLKHVTGFPVASLATGWRPFEIFVLVVAAVLVAAAIPGWFASRVPATFAIDE
jgi:putative ABC transport system permease protein